MSPTIQIFADFNYADEHGRLRLNCNGALEDLRRLGISLENGMELKLSDGELFADGIAVFSEEENIWVAVIDWDKIRTENGEI